jgi:hypothetical protein
MTTYVFSPQLKKGALIGVDPANPLARAIIFQYNPETLTRTLQPQTSEAKESQADALRLKGPPTETIRAEVLLDASDQLEQGDPATGSFGLLPVLSALEILVYPKSSTVIANQALAAAGILEIVPPEAPLTLFVWGPQRILPVRLNTITITEEAFDPQLNPIRAKVSLDMRVLTYQELSLDSYGGSLFLAHQMLKELIGAQGSVFKAI